METKKTVTNEGCKIKLSLASQVKHNIYYTPNKIIIINNDKEYIYSLNCFGGYASGGLNCCCVGELLFYSPNAQELEKLDYEGKEKLLSLLSDKTSKFIIEILPEYDLTEDEDKVDFEKKLDDNVFTYCSGELRIEAYDEIKTFNFAYKTVCYS